MTNVLQFIAGEDVHVGDRLEFRATDGLVYCYVAFPSRRERFMRWIGWRAVPQIVGIAGRDAGRGETLLVVNSVEIMSSRVTMNGIPSKEGEPIGLIEDGYLLIGKRDKWQR